MEHLTVAQAAERLGLSKTTVYAMCSRERPLIRHYRLGATGATIRIPAEAIAEYLAAAMVEPDWTPRREPTMPPLRFLREPKNR